MKFIIKKIFIFVCCLVCLPAYCDVFSTSGHTKSNGLNIELHYPSGWSAEEGIRPHIVQKFTDKNNNVCLLLVRDIGKKLSKKQWEREIKYNSIEDYKDIFGANFISNIKQTEYENIPGVLVEYEATHNRAGMNAYAKGLGHLLGYKSSMIFIQCMSVGLTKQEAQEKFDAVIHDFWSFGNGLVLLDKYDSFEPDKPDWLTFGNIIILLLTIIFIALITTVVLLKQNSTKTATNKVYNKKKQSD